MKRLLKILALAVVVCLVISVGAVASEHSESGGLTFFQQIPIVDQPVTEIAYIDMQVLFEHWKTSMPLDLNDLYASWKTPALPLVGMTAAVGDYRAWLGQADVVKETTGFDLFAVRQIVELGPESDRQLWLRGDFDMDAIRSKLSELGYAQVGDGNDELSIFGIDGRLDVDGKTCPRGGMPFFGGHLGRCQPVLLAGSAVATTLTPERFEALLAEETDLLSEHEQVAGTVELFQRDERAIGQLVSFAGERAAKIALPGDAGDHSAMAVPDVIALADLYKDDTHVVEMILTFADDDSAGTVETHLAERLPTTKLAYLDTPFAEALEALNGRLAAVARDKETVIVTFSFDDPAAADSDEVPAGLRAFSEIHKYLIMNLFDWTDLLAAGDGA